SRLRESGKQIIGMGETKTPEAFVSACDRFIYLNTISGNRADEKENKRIRPMKVIEAAIVEILDENEDSGKSETNIGEVGSRLLKRYPDFDIRNYGYKKFSSFCENLKSVEVHRNNNIVSLTAKNTADRSNEKTKNTPKNKSKK
nr:hypothetical protein [Lachnospiraceae bacterium]